jgi:superfamily II DNA/RNA helicase
VRFTDFPFDERLLEGIESAGYETPTPVQEQVIPHILNGKDIIASAQTGTGKTAAFLLPLIQRIITEPHAPHSINALVIVPTRELAIQIEQNLEGISYFAGTSSIAVYGGGDGNAFVQEKKALSMGADFVICTPGKMMAHIKMGYVKLDGLKYLVLDEADRMLDMGFYDDILFIIKHLPPKRQNLLFSATMPPKIRELARRILHQPEEINIAISKPPAKIKQWIYIANDSQKTALVGHLLKEQTFNKVVVFCSSKLAVKQLTRELKRLRLSADEIHSDLDQDKREEVLMQFRSGKLHMLVATDILSRGIDIDDIDLVINYDVPHDGEDYVHRIGRTARAESDGTAYTLVSPREYRKMLSIERLIGQEVPRGILPESVGPAPELPQPGAGSNGRNRNHRGGPPHRNNRNDRKPRSNGPSRPSSSRPS